MFQHKAPPRADYACTAPWMGPVIHPEYIDNGKYNVSDDMRYRIQIKEWCEFLRARIPEIMASASCSKVELDDYVKSLNYLIKGVHDSPYLLEAQRLVSQMKKLMKSDKLTDDYQGFDQSNWYTFSLKKDRHHLRKYVAFVHQQINDCLKNMTKVIEGKARHKVEIKDLHIAELLEYEEFLDLLIKKCYFREEDIFGTLFPEGRKIFKILQGTYKRFKKAQASQK